MKKNILILFILIIIIVGIILVFSNKETLILEEKENVVEIEISKESENKDISSPQENYNDSTDVEFTQESVVNENGDWKVVKFKDGTSFSIPTSSRWKLERVMSGGNELFFMRKYNSPKENFFVVGVLDTIFQEVEDDWPLGCYGNDDEIGVCFSGSDSEIQDLMNLVMSTLK